MRGDFISDHLKTDERNISERPMITIAQAEYDQLQLGARLLGALQACGVDNWAGFDDAIDMLNT